MQSSSTSLRVAGLAAVLAPFLLIGATAFAEDVDYFAKQVAPYTTKPTFAEPGAAFDAKQCAKGKTIFSIPQSSANPFTANIEKAMQAVAAKIGLGFTVWQNQGNRTEYVQGMNTALNQKASLIDLLAGPDPRALVPQVKAAAAAGIPTVASHFNGYEQSKEVAKYAAGDIPIDYVKAGALMTDWAIAHTDGKLNALIVTAPGPLSSDSTLAGIKGELAKCPSCKSRVLEFPDSWASKITPGVQAALLADPTIARRAAPRQSSLAAAIQPSRLQVWIASLAMTTATGFLSTQPRMLRLHRSAPA